MMGIPLREKNPNPPLVFKTGANRGLSKNRKPLVFISQPFTPFPVFILPAGQ